MNINIQGGEIVKRSVSILVCTLFLLVTLSVPAFASGGFDFQLVPGNDPPLYACTGSVANGNYLLQVVAGGSEYFDLGVVNIQLEYNSIDDIYFSTSRFELDGRLLYFSFLLSNEFLGGTVLMIQEEDYSFPDCSEEISFRLVPVSASFSDSVTSALGDVIGWIGVVLDSFMSGPLAPLLLILCVPIAVTALVFSIKAIKKNSWGI